MKNLKLYVLILAVILPTSLTLGNNKNQSNSAGSKEEEFQQVVNEYREYVAKIPVSVRDEVIEYRKEVAKLNKEKRVLYRKLSQDAQDYLKQVQSYKKRLPMNKRKMLNDSKAS